ncbi:MAG: type I secretion system permease/ATPase [Oxalobacteraceae bacterium]|jgi:ATP-binding cassette, subfamily C, bacterial exporter for protease/lipase|nr:type I secretion system permease/ATPase [Oxalobacteraceae bacterium]
MTQIAVTGEDRGSASSLTQSLSTFKKDVFLIGVFSFVANVLTLSPTLYMLQVFDRVMISQSELTLIALTLIIAVFIAAMAFSEWVRSRLLVRAGARFDEQLNTPIFNASFDANLEQKRADDTNHFSALARLRQFLSGNGLIAFFDLPWVPVYLFVLFAMHPMLGWFGLGFALFLGVLAWLSSQWTSVHLEHATSSEGRTHDYLAGKLRHFEVIQAMGMLGNLRRRWLLLYEEHVSAHWRAQQRAGQMAALLKFVQYSQQSLILALGAWLAIRGELSLGAMIASNVLMGNALRPIGVLVSTWKGFVQARQSYKDIRKLLGQYPERTEGYRANRVAGHITLHQLSAYARHRQTPILDSIDIHFEAGEVIGIAGASGAGKSTLARCLIGIWPSISGKVLLDGVDIRDWSREALGPHIGYLPQDIELFEGTVAENICRFGDVDADAILDAAQRVDIHQMILRLPAGYDTPIGQAGKLLSGGQRQRLALARAIYGMPDLIVLDEPNANLDDAGEAALVQTIRDLKEAGKTVFLIAHQRHLLALADRLIVLTKGQITQTGKRQAGGTPTQSAPVRGAL